MSITHVTALEPGNRIQLPAEWATSLGPEAVLTLTDQGILVRPSSRSTWHEIFASKLAIGATQTELSDHAEVTGDDLIF